jgi:amino acid transporter
MLIAAVNKSILIPAAAVLIVQYVLALVALMKLFNNRPNKLNSLLWNLIIVLIIIIGPLVYLIIESPPKKQVPIQESEEDNKYNDYMI